MKKLTFALIALAASAYRADAELDWSTIQFSHPREISNPYLPLMRLKQDIIEGKEGKKKTRVERTALPEKHKMFEVHGLNFDSLAVEDREFEDGELSEVTTDYFAQDDAGTVYYLGEEVDKYDDGKIVSHEGSWMLGKTTQTPGVLLPAHPKVGDKFKSEDVNKEITEADGVISVSETVTVPFGTFKDCVKTKETTPDGVEYKYYAPNVGVVREIPGGGDELLISHTTQ